MTNVHTKEHTSPYLAVAGFDWDAGNCAKCLKHGVVAADIESAVCGVMRVFPAPERSTAETRYVGIGTTPAGRHLFVAFTLRSREGEQYIRPISARFMHASEVKYYETEIAKTAE